MLHKICCVGAAAALSLTACAARPTAVEQPRLSPTLASRIDAIALGALSHQHLASVSLAIAKDGAIVYARAYGQRDLGKRLPATPQTIYNIASMSKQFTAACIMLLQQDGKLTIDDPLSKYVSGLPYGITLRNLLNHTSGLPDYTDLLGPNDFSNRKILATLKKAPLQFAPGSKYQYSNSNYILLGLVVRAASGMAFEEFVTTRIFRPLRLISTSIGTAPKDLPAGAQGYTVVGGQTQAAEPQRVAQLDFPDGGINSTAIDVAKWDVALDSGQVVRNAILQMMFTPGPHGAETTFSYGLGLQITRAYGHREILHQGEWTGYAGENVTFPDDRFAIVLLSNTDGFNEELTARKIFALFFPPTPAQRTAASRSAPGENPAITGTAKAWLAGLTGGAIDKSRLTPDLAKSLSTSQIVVIRRELNRYDRLQRFVFVGRDSDSSGVTEYYRVYYPNAVALYGIAVNADGKIRNFSISRDD